MSRFLAVGCFLVFVRLSLGLDLVAVVFLLVRRSSVVIALLCSFSFSAGDAFHTAVTAL